MKTFTVALGILLLSCAVTLGASQTPIINGLLQNDLNANGKNINNGGTITGTHVGDGSGLTGLDTNNWSASAISHVLSLVFTNVPANYGFYGPASGAAAKPFFRFMVPLDMASNVFFTTTGTGIAIASNYTAGVWTYTFSVSGAAGAATNAIGNLNGIGTNTAIMAYFNVSNSVASLLLFYVSNNIVGVNTNLLVNGLATFTAGINSTSGANWTNGTFSAAGINTNDINGQIGSSTSVPEAWITGLTSDLGGKANSSITLTIAGTANQITSSAGAQDLTANRTWTLSIPNILLLPGSVSVTGLTNTSSTLLQGVETNSTVKGPVQGVVGIDINGMRYPVTNLVNLTINLATGTLTATGSGSQTPWLATENGNQQGLTNTARIVNNGTNGSSGVTVIDGYGVEYYSTNAPLFVVWDANTNDFVTAYGSNKVLKVTGEFVVSNLTSRLRIFPTGTNVMFMSVGTNSSGGFLTNIWYVGNGVTSNEVRFANSAGVDISLLQTNGDSQNIGVFSALNGLASYRSNSIGPVSFTFPATTVNWTNPINASIEVYIDNTGVTGTVFKKNGTQIFSSLVGDILIGLQPGEYFSETFTIGTPTGRWSPFP